MNNKVAEAVVTEDNGGGLALFVFADPERERCIYAHTDYEYVPGQLSADIDALLAGDYPPFDWDGNEDDPQDVWNEVANWLEKSWRDGIGYTSIVAVVDSDGLHIFPENMGVAASKEFGVND